MSRKSLRLSTALLLSLCLLPAFLRASPATATDAAPLTVETDRGQVRGAVRHGVREFRGIPYAAPTLGDERWTLPRPAAPWQGVLDASEFRGACPQVARFNLTEASDVEDCLTVHVSTPLSGGQKRPVFVYIHGGAWVGGSAILYRLDALARQGLVVVSMNYRLGALGFLAHPDLPREANGAWGIADQREALRWVQRNIAAFGGDPDNVTLGGESAGAGSVCLHLANPQLSAGLFHKAVVTSGACLAFRSKVADAERMGLTLAAAVGCADPDTALACLRRVPLATLLAKQTELGSGGIIGLAPSGGSPANPTDDIAPMKRGEFLRVPILMGATRDEMRLYVAYDLQAGKSVNAGNYLDWLRGIYGRTPEEQAARVPERIAERYPLDGTEPPPAILGTAMSDFIPSVGLGNCLQQHTGATMARYTPLWQWEFADRDAPVLGVGITREPDPGFLLGAVHAAELNYFFPNFDNTHRMVAPDLAPPSQALAEQMLEFLANFARTGKPAARGLPEWPKFSGGQTVMWMEPGKTGLRDAGAIHHCEFWKSVYPDRL